MFRGKKGCWVPIHGGGKVTEGRPIPLSHKSRGNLCDDFDKVGGSRSLFTEYFYKEICIETGKEREKERRIYDIFNLNK